MKHYWAEPIEDDNITVPTMYFQQKTIKKALECNLPGDYSLWVAEFNSIVDWYDRNWQWKFARRVKINEYVYPKDYKGPKKH